MKSLIFFIYDLKYGYYMIKNSIITRTIQYIKEERLSIEGYKAKVLEGEVANYLNQIIKSKDGILELIYNIIYK